MEEPLGGASGGSGGSSKKVFQQVQRSSIISSSSVGAGAGGDNSGNSDPLALDPLSAFLKQEEDKPAPPPPKPMAMAMPVPFPEPLGSPKETSVPRKTAPVAAANINPVVHPPVTTAYGHAATTPLTVPEPGAGALRPTYRSSAKETKFGMISDIMSLASSSLKSAIYTSSHASDLAAAGSRHHNSTPHSGTSSATTNGAGVAAAPRIFHLPSEQQQPGSPPIGATFAASSSPDDCIPLLTGEHKLIDLNNALLQVAPGKLLQGTLYMTNYRLHFEPNQSHLAALGAVNPSVYSWLDVPLASIDRVEKEKRSGKEGSGQIASTNSGVTILVYCKDVRQHRIILQTKKMSEADIDRAITVMLTYAFPNNMLYLFAFSHSLPALPAHLSRVEPYDAIQEFSRQGILDNRPSASSHDTAMKDSMWRTSLANRDYRLCNSYPKVLVVPRFISDDELSVIAGFRSGHRLPVLCWGDKHTGATMWRSSQPKAGVSGSNASDEKLLEIIAQSTKHFKPPSRRPSGVVSAGSTIFEPLLHIVDCRPRTSAVANRAAGAGYEPQANYPHSKLEFYNIGNIHVMRDSYRSLVTLVSNSSPYSEGDAYFSKQVEDTLWLTHVRLVLKASWETAAFIANGAPVLVHCSHGWDRTAQVCALAQLMLDPFYRTIDGFKVLVEKEWNSFGHQFQMRLGHGMDKAARQDDQISPIFIQFLDCVWQLVNQQPQQFEFNARYLLAVADHIYSCRFGTFLFSCDQDREIHNVRDRCLDLWTYLHYNRTDLTSPIYQDPNLELSKAARIFLPPQSSLLRNVTLWKDYYYRWATFPSLLSCPDHWNKHLFINGVCRLSREADPASTCYDLQLPAAVTSEDLWHSLHLRGLQEQQQQHLHQLSASASTDALPITEDAVADNAAGSSLSADLEPSDEPESIATMVREDSSDSLTQEAQTLISQRDEDNNSSGKDLEEDPDVVEEDVSLFSGGRQNASPALPSVSDVNNEVIIDNLVRLLKECGISEDRISAACSSNSGFYSL